MNDIQRQTFYERIFGRSCVEVPESPVVKHAVEKAKSKGTQNNGFSLKDLTDFYRINGVNCRKGVYTVDLSKTLLPSQTQDKHAEDRKEAIENNTDRFYAPSYPEFYALVSSLERNKDNPQYQDELEKLRQFLKDSALKNWLIMLTRVRYNPQGNDVVIHNYKQQDQYEIPVNFVGPDGAILSADNAEKPVQSLLDTKQSLQEINDTYKWLTDVDSYIWRVNLKPEQPDERVARFGAGSVRAYLRCDWDPRYSGASLGVKFYPQGRAKNLGV